MEPIGSIGIIIAQEAFAPNVEELEYPNDESNDPIDELNHSIDDYNKV